MKKLIASLVLTLVVGPASWMTPAPTLAARTDRSKSLTKCQKAIQKETAKYGAGVEKALARCLQKIVQEVVEEDQTPGGGIDVSPATRTCLSQLYKLGRTDGKSLADKFYDKVGKACDPTHPKFRGDHTETDVFDVAGGGLQKLAVQDKLDAYCGDVAAGATTIAEWANCLEASTACQAHQRIALEYARSLRWLDLMETEIGLSTNRKAVDALIAIETVNAAIEGATDDDVPEISCGPAAVALDTCTTNLDMCQNPTCGNGQADSGEQCDGSDLNGASCASLGYDTGTLSCTACAFDTSACVENCGNATIDLGEDCDLSQPGHHTCISQGFWSGSISCGAGCAYDTSACVGCATFGGVEVGGFCWFLGEFDESCTDACTAAGLNYDSATHTYAGGGGTSANCRSVMEAVGSPTDLLSSGHCGAFNGGCTYLGGSSDFNRRCSTTTAGDSSADARRACACRL